MKNDNVEELFQSLDFDVVEPTENHRERFLKKLNSEETKPKNKPGNRYLFSMWGPALAIAASLLAVFLLFQDILLNRLDQKQELASVSSEMKTTQDFYASAIKTELYKLQQYKNPETEAVIQDALKQLEILETDYKKLKTDLAESGHDQRVIYAMISNFQQRINVLNNVLETVKNINEQKQQPHENPVL